MTAAPVEAPVGGRLRGSWARASGGAALAFAATLALGEALAILDLFGLPGPPQFGLGSTLKLGGLYLASFNHVGLEVVGEAGGWVLTASCPPMLGTLLAIWLLYRAGKRAAEGSADNLLERGSLGVKVAPAYAALVLATELILRANLFTEGGFTVRPVAPFFWPLVLSAAAGFAGGVMGEGTDSGKECDRPALAILRGGWNMLALGFVGSFLALAFVAAVAPAYSRVYLAGFRTARGPGGAVAVAHNTLLLPNESVWALVASMGACDGVYGARGIDMVCWSHFPAEPFSVQGSSPSAVEAQPAPRPPLVFGVFLLVPPAATIVGGALAARIARLRRSGSAAAIGAASGVVFAALAGSTAYFSGVAMTLGPDLEGLWDGNRLFLGPRVWAAAAVALIWGLFGGALGGVAGSALCRGRHPEVGGRLRLGVAGDEEHEVQDPPDQADPAEHDSRDGESSARLSTHRHVDLPAGFVPENQRRYLTDAEDEETDDP